jgi:hypothetical protein
MNGSVHNVGSSVNSAFPTIAPVPSMPAISVTFRTPADVSGTTV